MRALGALLAALVAVCPSSASAQSVLLSELCDPKQNFLTDRFIEIYNAGAGSVDLTGWSVVAVGNSVDIFTWNLSGSIAPGEALVCGDLTTVIAFPVDFPDDQWSNNNSTWNGKVGDGAKLLSPGAVLVDIVVGTGTTFENDDYVRNDDITAPNTTYTPAEWTATAVEFPTDGSPGTHTVGPPPAGPTITNVVTAPLYPASGDAVHVSADISDSTGTVTAAEVHWGTAPASLTNTIAMSLGGGSTWTTNTPIPSQAQGTTVHYEVQATNNSAQTTVLTGLSYDVPLELDVSTIQGMAASSPHDGSAAITGGVVTADYGAFYVIQDGAGAWNGLWIDSFGTVAVGDSVSVRGRITESLTGHAGNTILASTTILTQVPGAALPAATAATSSAAGTEDHEGVLVQVLSAECTTVAFGQGEWEVNDGSGALRVGALGFAFVPTLGTQYDVTGCIDFESSLFKVEPRSAGDIVWAADAFAPVIETVSVTSDTTLLVVFSEDVELATANTPGNYTIAGLTVSGATRDAAVHNEVDLTVSTMTPGTYTLSVSSVEDLFGNATAGAMQTFDFVSHSPPAGYYDTAEGLTGDALRTALHGIIQGHTVIPLSNTWVSFQTTDDKPNGKVWDIYSDVPGGTPPYEYTFGVDQGGVGGVEGTGYNREHTWPQSWFGGGVPPMESDLFQLYPTDNFVNGQRGNDPYGVVGSPTWTSMNGSKTGTCTYPGYAGPAFEPIDAYKGDVARNYFYMSARYYLQDGGWPGSPMVSGATLLPWAAAMLLEWHAGDPVDQKELDRNGTIFIMQLNRNPFIDRPEFAERMLSTALAVLEPVPLSFSLSQNAPNPFRSGTMIRFAVPAETDVRVAVYDTAGRLVTTLLDGAVSPGAHSVRWDSTNRTGARVTSGVYFYRVETAERQATRRMVLLR